MYVGWRGSKSVQRSANNLHGDVPGLLAPAYGPGRPRVTQRPMSLWWLDCLPGAGALGWAEPRIEDMCVSVGVIKNNCASHPQQHLLELHLVYLHAARVTQGGPG